MEETEDMEYPVVGRLSGEREEALCSPCMGIDEKGDPYDVLIVGVGLE